LLFVQRRLGRDGRFFEAVDLQGKIGNQSFQVVVLPLEVSGLLTGGVSHRVPGETLFPRSHEFFGPGIEDAWLGPLPPAKATDAHLPTGPFQTGLFQNDSDLVFRGVFPAGPGPYLPDESLGLLS
jgi:hypothetical protein